MTLTELLIALGQQTGGPTEKLNLISSYYSDCETVLPKEVKDFYNQQIEKKRSEGSQSVKKKIKKAKTDFHMPTFHPVLKFKSAKCLTCDCAITTGWVWMIDGQWVNYCVHQRCWPEDYKDKMNNSKKFIAWRSPKLVAAQ